MQKKPCYRIVVASPSDVMEERHKLDDIVAELNRGIAAEKGIILELFKWETDSFPHFHPQGPQGAVNDSLNLEDTDILIGIFWTRFGTPTIEGQTGTEYELRRAHTLWEERAKDPHRRPWIMIYFNSAPFNPQSIDSLEQKKQVLQFRHTFSRDALYGDYNGPDEFEEKVRNGLTQIVRKLDVGLPAAVTPPPSEPPRADHAVSKDWNTLPLDKVPLFTFSGLLNKLRDADVFQDFRVDRERYSNPNPISYLWADGYTGCSINAIIVEDNPPYLKLRFDNQPISWPGNVCIRPIGESAITLRARRTLSLEMRLAKDLDDTLTQGAVAFRLINGWGQHWAYGPGPGRYRQFTLTDDWADIDLDTVEGKWWLFNSDGNHYYGPHEPDFRVIAGVVIECGSTALERPGAGKGTIHLRQIRLTN